MRVKMAIVMHQPFWYIVVAGKKLRTPNVSGAFLKTNMFEMNE